MTLKLPDIVIETLINALNDGILIQKQARLCDLAALDFIPTEILPHLKLHHQKAIATSSATSQKIRTKLIRFVPVNYRTSNNLDNPERLKILSQSEDWRERTRVAENPNTPVDVLEILAEDPFDNDGTGSAFVRKAVAGNPASPIKILEKLARDWSKSVRSSVASNPSTPIYLLESLATDIYGVPVFYALARNPSIPSFLLVYIAKLTTDIMILELIAEHPNTPPEMLVELLTRVDKKWLGRLTIAIVNNYNAPPELIKETYLYSLELSSLLDISFREKHLYRQSIKIRTAIAENPNTPISILQELETEIDTTVMYGLAKNKKLTIDFIERLASDYSDDVLVQQGLAQNISVPINILEKLAKHRNYYVRKQAVENIHNIYHSIAANQETSVEQLQEMLKHQDIKMRLAVTQHPQGLGLLLDRCLKPERCLPEQNSLNRVLAGMHPAISQKQIDNLFRSDNWLDRLSVACNHKCSEEYLLQLTQDENDVVRQTARELLKRK